ncbi:hypothetical protein PILCRDRAFT_817820 [Piloderma croceum F 1598]|uniref:Uncharacterized protein n=1 Tax=Piloderma croceum (strain F 1598) TaxID=765440 RepID=A0A0C3FLN0_PILCF|nr:hypothetical protein PILCRDRAFT_817820 [Piloderma croceum F 1598]
MSASKATYPNNLRATGVCGDVSLLDRDNSASTFAIINRRLSNANNPTHVTALTANSTL